VSRSAECHDAILGQPYLKIDSEHMKGIVSEGNCKLRGVRVPSHTSRHWTWPIPCAWKAAHQVFIGNLKETIQLIKVHPLCFFVIYLKAKSIWPKYFLNRFKGWLVHHSDILRRTKIEVEKRRPKEASNVTLMTFFSGEISTPTQTTTQGLFYHN